MKYLFTIAFILICLLSQSELKAQQIEVQAYAQETIVGIQKGYSIRKVAKSGMKVGIFHQSTRNFSFLEDGNNYPYTGGEISYPVTSCGNIRLYATLKAGILNQQFILAVPEIESEVTLNRYVNISIASSYRAGEAAVALKASIRLF